MATPGEGGEPADATGGICDRRESPPEVGKPGALAPVQGAPWWGSRFKYGRICERSESRTNLNGGQSHGPPAGERGG